MDKRQKKQFNDNYNINCCTWSIYVVLVLIFNLKQLKYEPRRY